eukprot:3575862-Rhodomonas_salina.1
MPGTDVAYGPTLPPSMSLSPISLRALPACHPTLSQYSISLPTSYAMPGTDVADVPTPCTFSTSLRTSYAMPGTDIAYAAAAGMGWRQRSP